MGHKGSKQTSGDHTKEADGLLQQDIPTLLDWLSLPESSEGLSAEQLKKLKWPKIRYPDDELIMAMGSRLYQTDVSVEAILSAIEFQPLRKIRDEKPQVYLTLIKVVLEKLEGTVVGSSVGKEDKRLPMILNSLRTLARLMVVAQEQIEGDVQKLLWTPPNDKVREDQKDNDSDNVVDYPIARRVFCALANLLFVPGFTLPANAVVDKVAASSTTMNSHDPLSFMDDSRLLVWERFKDKISFDVVNTLDGNRVEVLRALLACLCQDLYVSADEFKHDRNYWMKIFVESTAFPSLRPRISVQNATVRPLVRPSTIFWSLFSVIVNFNPNPKAKGIVAVLPNTLTDISSREVLVTMAIHILFIAFEFRKTSHASENDDQEDSKETRNLFLSYFKEIRRPKDLEVVFESILRLLNNNIMVSGHQMVNAGLRTLEIYDELIILTWKMVDENRAFFKLILNSPMLPELIRPILFYMYKCKDDPSKAGLLHACALTLLRLSAERDFSVALNAKYEAQLPIDVPRIDNGNLGDLLVIVVHKLIIAQLQHLESLFHVLLTILQNTSPYMTRLSMYASVRLMNLFELLSSPAFLTAAPGNFQFVIFILDIINNLIQYQYGGSSRLVFCMLRRANLFYDIVGLDAKILNDHVSNLKAGKVAAQTVFGGKSEVQGLEDEEKAAQKAVMRKENHSDVTVEFINSWKQKLQTKALFALLEYLIPRLRNLAEDRNLDNEDAVLTLIERTTVVGILPPPQPIVVRRYASTHYTTVWFSTYIWGLIFLRNERPVLIDPPTVKLFVCGFVEEQKESEKKT